MNRLLEFLEWQRERKEEKPMDGGMQFDFNLMMGLIEAFQKECPWTPQKKGSRLCEFLFWVFKRAEGKRRCLRRVQGEIRYVKTNEQDEKELVMDLIEKFQEARPMEASMT